jgi:WD40 repeat protein
VALSCVLQWLEGAEPARVEKTSKQLGSVGEVLTCVVAHPHRDLLLLGTNSGRIIFWDIAKQQSVGTSQAHDRDVTRIIFSTSGDRLLTSSLDGTLVVWDAQFAQLQKIEVGNPVYAAAWSPSGKLIAGGGKEKFLVCWDSNSGEPTNKLVGSAEDVAACAFVSDKLLISAGTNGIMRVWEVDANRSIRSQQAHRQHVVQVLVAPSGSWYATASWDKTIKIWNLQHKTKFSIPEGAQAITSIVSTADERLLIAAYWDGSVRLWNMDTGELFDQFQAHDSSQIGCTLTGDGKYLVTADQAGTLRAWDFSEMGVVQFHNKHAGEVYSVQYTPDNLKVISAGYDGRLKIWDRSERREVGFMNCHDRPATACAVSHDNRYWATASLDGTIKVWDVEQQALDCTLSGHRHLVSGLEFYPAEGKLVSSSWDLKIRFWSVPTQQTECTFEGHGKEVDSIDISLDGRRMVSASWDRTVRVWNLADRRSEIGKELFSLAGHTDRLLCCAFSPDGTKIASGSSDRTVRLWGADKRADSQILDGHTSEVSACRFTPDGSILVTTDRAGVIIAWDADTGERVSTLEHGVPILTLAIAPDGQEGVIGDQEGRVRFFALDYSLGAVWVPASTYFERQKSFWSRTEKAIECYQITCIYCGQAQKIEREHLGREWGCSNCQQKIKVCPMPMLPAQL